MADALVIGAGPAGLATAAMLKRAGLVPRLFEQSDRVGVSWHRHYAGLRLHTVKGRSALPGFPMPQNYPRFPNRDQVIAYLQSYADHFHLAPDLGVQVTQAHQDAKGWSVTHTKGVAHAPILVFATGLNGQPHQPTWPGQDHFTGRILHASRYRTASDFTGQRVLVVGLGNSGGDIAVELADAGIDTQLSVRGPVNIVPMLLMGVPITSMGLLRKLFGYRAADAIAAPALRAAIGRPRDYGLAEPSKGPMAQLVEDGKVPLIDHGVLAAIRGGDLWVRPGIASFDGGHVVFSDGTRAAFDTVILATGYRPDLRPILGDRPDLLEAGRPKLSGAPTAAKGLYFCAYHASPEGQLRQAGFDAQAIARHGATLVR